MPPVCNCHSCKPHRIHLNLNLNPNSLNHNINRQQKYRARALSASPSPPPVPPQPNRFIQFNESNTIVSKLYRNDVPSIDIPELPTRRYHLLPIRAENNNNNIKNQSPTIDTQPNLSSFGRSSYNNNDRHNDYENTRDIVRPPVVVKDPRRKPYYYNELGQSLDANENINIPHTNLELMKSVDETQTIHTSALSSGDSLDNII